MKVGYSEGFDLCIERGYFEGVWDGREVTDADKDG
jgi:hypothetical protein